MFSLLPLAYLLIHVATGNRQTVLTTISSPRTLSLLWNSAFLVVTVTGLAVIIGVALAWLTERTDLPGRSVWRVAGALPLAMPSYVAAYAWISTTSLEGAWGSVLVLTGSTFPYVYLSAAAALRGAGGTLEEVSGSLGRGRWTTFARVTWPTVRPAAAAGGLLVATYALSDFGSVALMRFDVFTRAIFMSYRASFDRLPAAVLACVLVGMTLLITAAEMRTRSRAASFGAAQGPKRPPTPLALGAWRWPAVGSVVVLLLVSLGYPVVVVVGWFVRDLAGGLPAELPTVVANTVVVCAIAGACATLAALPLGIYAARSRSRLSRALQQVVYFAHGLPGLVVALAIVFFGVRYARAIYQEIPLLVLTYVLLLLSAAMGAIRGAVVVSSPRIEEAARSLGAGTGLVMRRVTLPLAMPGIAAGFVLVMLSAMKELPATLLLRPAGFETLATRLWLYTEDLSYAAAAPYALGLVLVAIFPAVMLVRVSLPKAEATRRAGMWRASRHENSTQALADD
ncbi:ABC transporter permease [Granulicoccus sp. GXG6511]|uniref:ABC transporter permease n=1 Tax=Granulicoccus sp. GXG6511 TaxID=3381351 RepID=UPI003D7EF3B6